MGEHNITERTMPNKRGTLAPVIPSERSESRDLQLLAIDPSTSPPHSTGMTGNRKYFIISLTLHILLIAAFALQLKYSKPHINYGNSHQQVVSSYLFNASGLPKPAAREIKQPRLVKRIKHAIALTHKKVNTQTQAHKSAAPHRRAEVAGKPMPELIALLHAAIQRQQRYPASAQEMEREGRVRLTFTLLTNGMVQNLAVAQSSGTASLDNAAIDAVNRALPFQKVDKFIHNPQTYQIDVVFQLS